MTAHATSLSTPCCRIGLTFLGHFEVTFGEARSGTEHSARLGVALPVPDFMRH